jgi:hypothetical protein
LCVLNTDKDGQGAEARPYGYTVPVFGVPKVTLAKMRLHLKPLIHGKTVCCALWRLNCPGFLTADQTIQRIQTGP